MIRRRVRERESSCHIRRDIRRIKDGAERAGRNRRDSPLFILSFSLPLLLSHVFSLIWHHSALLGGFQGALARNGDTTLSSTQCTAQRTLAPPRPQHAKFDMHHMTTRIWAGACGAVYLAYTHARASHPRRALWGVLPPPPPPPRRNAWEGG